MKIAIDISQVVYGTGVSVYVENLVKNLLEIDRENSYILYAGILRRFGDLKKFFGSLPKSSNFQKRIFPISPTFAHIIWNKMHVFPIDYLVGNMDIFHSSDWTQPPTRAYKVTTIHDLYQIKFPDYCDPKIVSVHRARLSWVKKEIDKVIVPSFATFNDLVDLGFQKEKISIVAEAVDPVFRPKSQKIINKILRKYKITKKYILSIGYSERKNSARIIEVFQNYFQKQGYLLVFTGNYPVGLNFGNSIRFLGHIPKKDLPALYSGATVLLYPSIYEGFGLPVLEAFACKCPVVTSNTSSLPEVGKGGAVLVDPYSVDSIADGVLKVIKKRRSLVDKGIKKIKSFSWRKTAMETLKVYNRMF